MRIVRILGFPVAVVYGLVVHIRNFLFDRGLLASRSFKTPTICVGNLSVGGTGKTPMIEYLVRLLAKDHKVAVLSRGYKRKSTGFQLAHVGSDAYQLGDEPFQIHKKFSEITVAVDANRTHGIVTLENKVQPDIILLDDAFQHRKVVPSLAILLTAYDQLFYDDFYLPTGSLRDAKNQKNRADIIVVTKCPKDLPQKEQNAIVARMKTVRTVFFTYLEYDQGVRSTNGNLSYKDIEGKKIGLVTGIANPKPMVDFLKGKGVDFTHHAFADHHFFSEKELNRFKQFDVILTTEKDYVRLGDKVPHAYYVGVRHQFLPSQGVGFNTILAEKLKNHLVSWP